MRVVCGSKFAPIFHPQLGTILVSQAHPSRMLSSVICSDFEHFRITVRFQPSTTDQWDGVQILQGAPKRVGLTNLNSEVCAYLLGHHHIPPPQNQPELGVCGCEEASASLGLTPLCR